MFLPAKENRASALCHFVNMHIGCVTSGGGVGVGWGDVNIMLTCGRCACYVTSGGWGWGGRFPLSGIIFLGHVVACFPISFHNEQAVLTSRQ